MRDKKQEMHAGDDSQNYQAKGDIHITNNDLNYVQVKEIFTDLFKANFYDLQEEARDIANQRAEYVTNQFLEKLQQENPDLIKNTRDPDIRANIFEVQKAYARSGDENLSDILVNMLVERTKDDNQEIIDLVLNEAITVVPKMNKAQINILMFIFIIKHTSFRNNPSMNFVIFKQIFIDPCEFEWNDFYKNINYSHLEYTSCLSVGIGQTTFEKIVLLKEFNHLKSDEDVERYKSNNEFSEIMKVWNNTQLKNCTLSTVGIAIAITSLNNLIGWQFKLPYNTFLSS